MAVVCTRSDRPCSRDNPDADPVGPHLGPYPEAAGSGRNSRRSPIRRSGWPPSTWSLRWWKAIGSARKPCRTNVTSQPERSRSMADRMDFTKGPVAQRARRNPLLATTHAVETLVTVAAEPAVLSFIMDCVVRCLDDKGRAALQDRLPHLHGHHRQAGGEAPRRLGRCARAAPPGCRGAGYPGG